MRKILDFWNIKPIYEIDEYGNVYNFYKNKQRKVFLSDDGYLSVVLYTNDNKRKNFRINRLIARAFHGEPEDKSFVAEHIDNEPLNNYYLNIRWGSHSHNQYWHRYTKGVRCKDLTEQDIDNLCRMIAEGCSTNYILNYFNIGSKKTDRENFNRFVRRISAIKHKKLYYDVYKKYLPNSSTTIENEEDNYYTIEISL